MKSIMLKTFVTGLCAVGLIGLGAVAPATAGSLNALPTGQSLYVIDASVNAVGMFETTNLGVMTHLDLQYNSVANGIYGAGALNPIDNKAYLVFTESDINSDCYIDQIDLLGGAPAARVHVTGDQIPFECFGLNIDSSGTALINGVWDDGVNYINAIWQVDLATGIISNKVDIEAGLFGFTVSPSGDWYGLTDTGSLVRIDSTTGVFTTVVTKTLNDVYDIKFDSDGTLWFTDAEAYLVHRLYSWREGDTDYTLQAETTDGIMPHFGPVFVGASTQTITDEQNGSTTDTVAPKLSNTGQNDAVLMGSAGLAGAVIAVGIVTLVMIRRRHP